MRSRPQVLPPPSLLPTHVSSAAEEAERELRRDPAQKTTASAGPLCSWKSSASSVSSPASLEGKRMGGTREIGTLQS
jgi:hypothetical protein